MKISASFLSIKDNLEENIKLLDQTSISYLHLDIMDGKFVENKTWSFKYIKKLLKNTSKKKDVHLMVSDVKKYVKKYIKLKPDIITFHIEASSNPFEMIKMIKEKGIKAGLSIKPNTSVDTIIDYLPYIDVVLVMSVEPGKGGQEFISSTTGKIEALNKLKEDNNYNYLIEVDGGINDNTIKLIDTIDIAVVGSFITNSSNYQEQIDKLNNDSNQK